MVPVPEVRSLEELNRKLEERCLDELGRTLRGKGRTKGRLLEEERTRFIDLPDAPFDACRIKSTTASSLSLVRFDRNDYSVPVRYAHYETVVKGYIDRVVVCRGDRRIAEHPPFVGQGGCSLRSRSLSRPARTQARRIRLCPSA